jgi:hypothetical protein
MLVITRNKIASGFTYLATVNHTLDTLKMLLESQQPFVDGTRQVGKTALVNQLLLSGALKFNEADNTDDNTSVKRRRIGNK